MKMEEFYYASSDKKSKIHAIKWIPEQEVKGVIQIVHGVTEYIGRYEEVAEYFTKLGYVVVGHDLLGHGDSLTYGKFKMYSGERGSFKYLVEDTRSLFNIIKKEYKNATYVMLGFSLGSFVVRSYLEKYSNDLDGTIIMGSGYTNPLLLKMILKLVNNEASKYREEETTPLIHKLTFETYNNNFKPNKTDYDWLCSNESSLKKYINDPKRGEEFSIGLFRELLEAMIETGKLKNIEKINKDLPILLISGSCDPVGNNTKGVKKVYSLYKKARISNVTMKFYPGLRHDILHEKEKKDICEYLSRWISVRVRKEYLEDKKL